MKKYTIKRHVSAKEMTREEYIHATSKVIPSSGPANEAGYMVVDDNDGYVNWIPKEKFELITKG